MNKTTLLLVILNLLVAAMLWFVIKTLKDAGQFKEIKSHFEGTSKTIDGIIGGEDLTIWNNFAIIAADDRFSYEQGEATEGKILRLNLDDPLAIPKVLFKSVEPNQFHPHGLSLLAIDSSSFYLFVIDHTNREHKVIRFLFKDNSLKEDKIYRNNNFMISPNDIVAVGPDEFYFTNDHGETTPFKRKIEEYLQQPKSTVVYFDGENYEFVAKDIKYANGINVSKDGSTIYVAATIDKSINNYRRNKENGSLELKSKTFVNTGVDNIEVDQKGDLWIAAHPKLLTFVSYSKNPIKKSSPSEILRITSPDTDPKVETIMMDNGFELSASSVAAPYKNKIVIGSVGDDNILICTMNSK